MSETVDFILRTAGSDESLVSTEWRGEVVLFLETTRAT